MIQRLRVISQLQEAFLSYQINDLTNVGYSLRIPNLYIDETDCDDEVDLIISDLEGIGIGKS